MPPERGDEERQRRAQMAKDEEISITSTKGSMHCGGGDILCEVRGVENEAVVQGIKQKSLGGSCGPATTIW